MSFYALKHNNSAIFLENRLRIMNKTKPEQLCLQFRSLQNVHIGNEQRNAVIEM